MTDKPTAQQPFPVLVVAADHRDGDLVATVVDAVRSATEATGDPDRYSRASVVLRHRGRPVASIDLDLPLRVEQVGARLPLLPPVAPVDTGKPHDDALPFISVVVPSVVAREDELEQCLASLDSLDYPRFEVVLVDNRPGPPADDVLPALQRRHPRCRVVREPRPGISAARNTGVRAADGEVVAFTDDDVRVDPSWLRALGRRFAGHPDEVVVTGLVLPQELETAAQVAYEAHYGGFGGERLFSAAHVRPATGARRGRVSQLDDGGTLVRTFAVYGIGAFGAGANMAFRRSHLLAHGGFDLALGTGTPARGGEDLAALVDALWSGGALGYEPCAIVHHTHRREQLQLERQLRGNGVGFTAMLTSLVVHDPRHALALGRLLPGALATMARQTVSRLVGEQSPGPAAAPTAGSSRRMVLLELSGMPLGPIAYWRSRRAARQLTPPLAAAHADPTAAGTTSRLQDVR